MPNEKTKGALGICRKAGKLVVGTDAVCESLAAKRKPFAVLVASDASENTAKRLTDKSKFYGTVQKILPLSCEELGLAIGKTGAVAAVAVTDENLCRLVIGTL